MSRKNDPKLLIPLSLYDYLLGCEEKVKDFAKRKAEAAAGEQKNEKSKKEQQSSSTSALEKLGGSVDAPLIEESGVTIVPPPSQVTTFIPPPKSGDKKKEKGQIDLTGKVRKRYKVKAMKFLEKLRQFSPEKFYFTETGNLVLNGNSLDLTIQEGCLNLS